MEVGKNRTGTTINSDTTIDDSGHETTGLDCWCDPTFQRLCPECDAESPAGCWCCGGTGSVQVNADDVEILGEAVVVVHYETQDEEDPEIGPLVVIEIE